MDRQSRSWAALSIIGIAARRVTRPIRKSPRRSGLRAEFEEESTGLRRESRVDRFLRHCGKKKPRFEAGLRRVSQHGVFHSAPPGQPAKAATVPALRSGSNPTVRADA